MKVRRWLSGAAVRASAGYAARDERAARLASMAEWFSLSASLPRRGSATSERATLVERGEWRL
eukprot:scaffold59563_cov30-Tisochrysis_lutea.AAC.1